MREIWSLLNTRQIFDTKIQFWSFFTLDWYFTVSFLSDFFIVGEIYSEMPVPSRKCPIGWFFFLQIYTFLCKYINQSKIWTKVSKISEKLIPRISFYKIRAHIWQVLFWKVTWTHTCCQLVSLQKMPTRTTLAFFRSKMASNFVEKCTTYVLRRIPTTLFKMFPSNILA